MLRFLAIAVAGLALSAPAAGAEDARAVARVTIVDPQGVKVAWPMAMPTVRGNANGASFTGNMPSMGMMMMPANARLLVRREADTGQPVTAPGGFEVKADSNGVVVRTDSAAPEGPATDDAITGALAGGAAASIGVGQALRLAYDGVPAPPALVVVVQYN